jgi:hypothetical protein
MNQFATPEAAIKRGFERIEAKGLKLGFWRGSLLYTDFKRAHEKGEDERAAVVTCLAGRAWDWPWFSDMSIAFQQIGFWPAMWEDAGLAPPPPWTRIEEDVKGSLLALTLVASVLVVRDIGDLIPTIKTTGWRITLVPGNPNCPAEKHFTKLNKRKVERGNISAVPPFFPGDTTSVRLLK